MADANDVFSASTPSSPALRRAVTLPHRPASSSNSNATRSGQQPGGLEIFYVHPSVRIVKFEPSPPASNGAGPTDRRHRRMESKDELGTLPYSSPFEQTMAVGPLRMYRTMQGFAMLSCGSGKCIRPIMPKSKSWCVDDASSKFVFPVGRTPQGRPIFWRMELPVDFPDHEAKAEELKGVLAQISQFEKAACPFVRNFHVEIPEPPAVPIKKKPWKPVERPQTAPNGSGPATPGAPIEKARTQRRSSTQHETGYFNQPALRTFGPSGVSNVGEGSYDPDITARGYRRSTLSKPDVVENVRSVTAPHLTLSTTPSSSLLHKTPLGPPIREESQASHNSEVSSDTWNSPSTPPSLNSAPIITQYPQENIQLSKRIERKTLSATTVSTVEVKVKVEPTTSPRPPRVWRMLDGQDEDDADSEDTRPFSPPAPCTPSPRRRLSTEDDYFDASESPSIHDESLSTPTGSLNRALSTGSESSATAPSTPPNAQEGTGRRPSMSSTERARNRRALSPLPSAAVLFTPTEGRTLQTARHLPTAIIQKTWEILLSPPSHLVEMVLQLAARVAQRLRNGQAWDGDADTDCEDDFEDHEEDDYGMAIRSVRTNSSSSIRLHELMKVRSRKRWDMPGAYGSDLD